MDNNKGMVGVLGFVLVCSSLCAQGRYYLCGSDEDGCYDYKSCACIPVDEQNYYKSYCLDFDRMVCKPLYQSPDCPAPLIFNNQGECLATIFQSEPRPACNMVSYSFCVENHIELCDQIVSLCDKLNA